MSTEREKLIMFADNCSLDCINKVNADTFKMEITFVDPETECDVLSTEIYVRDMGDGYVIQNCTKEKEFLYACIIRRKAPFLAVEDTSWYPRFKKRLGEREGMFRGYVTHLEEHFSEWLLMEHEDYAEELSEEDMEALVGDYLSELGDQIIEDEYRAEEEFCYITDAEVPW